MFSSYYDVYRNAKTVRFLIFLTPGEEGEGDAFGSICLFVWARKSKTIAPIDFDFLHEKYHTRGSVLL